MVFPINVTPEEVLVMKSKSKQYGFKTTSAFIRAAVESYHGNEEIAASLKRIEEGIKCFNNRMNECENGRMTE
jgi:hypothetical protein